ncbi:hypothetical protein BOTBODRAFT_189727 [Botryobasidium botryosum FD-172 SS1]|uniref:mRNA export factor GLE1 n=1 Tax=Botryobasidium botryosum (strain FD-172 SS1) TaxID=930990 RepID=A0A067M9Z2_BOTB1|nr:hypothetical protein BOTBODRAFT_189727 [Botryobasidium botryosum FD-172 SS1]
MRIHLPSRSPSPSAPSSPTTLPKKRLPRSRAPPRPRATSNRYGLRDTDETTDESSDEGASQGNASRSGKAVQNDWDFDCSPIPPPPNPNRPSKTAEQEWEQQDFYCAVKLRQRPDPLEEYEERGRREAWRDAHEQSAALWQPINALLDSTAQIAEQRVREARRQQMEEVTATLQKVQLRKAELEHLGRVELEAQNRALWNSIEESIRQTELEEKRREEEARRAVERAREEELARQKRAAEEAEAKARQAALEAEEKAKKEQEEKKLKEEEDRRKARDAQEKLEREASQGVAPKTGREEWEFYRDVLRRVKTEVLPQVKKTKGRPDVTPNAQWKQEYSRCRRQIVPKVGQVVNTAAAISRVTDEIHNILNASPPHHEVVYTALLYSLSRALIRQVEEEVVAASSAAFPLGRIAQNLIGLGHVQFAEVFVAVLNAATGGWAVGIPVPQDGCKDEGEYRKMIGLKSNEAPTDITQHFDRISGCMMLYGAILQSPLPPALESNPASVPYPFQLPRLWTWLARVMNDPTLTRSRAAPLVIGGILEAAGDRAAEIWGKQIGKLRRALGRKAMEKDGDDVLGGKDGDAGRVRLAIILERWEASGKIAPKGRDMDG